MQVRLKISTSLFSCLAPSSKLMECAAFLSLLSRLLSFLIHFSLFFPQFLCQHFSFPFSQHFPLCSLPTHTICLSCSSSDPGAVVETHSAVPYAVIGGVLALLVFTVICVLIVTIWCSVRQKGNPQTHSNSHIRWHKSYSHKHTSHFWESGYFIKFPQACFLNFSTFWLNTLWKYYWILVTLGVCETLCKIVSRKYAGQDAPLQPGTVRDKQPWKRKGWVGNVGVVPSVLWLHVSVSRLIY